ncbi:MAG: hypothetical protein U0575_13110 [Phycisphaerales bacterium]
MAPAFAPTACADDVAAWLERRGLTALLAAHLEEQMEANRDPQRKQQLATRLAGVYARLLEAGGDAATMADLDAEPQAARRRRRPDADEAALALIGASQRRRQGRGTVALPPARGRR